MLLADAHLEMGGGDCFECCANLGMLVYGRPVINSAPLQLAYVILQESCCPAFAHKVAKILSRWLITCKSCTIYRQQVG